MIALILAIIPVTPRCEVMIDVIQIHVHIFEHDYLLTYTYILYPIYYIPWESNNKPFPKHRQDFYRLYQPSSNARFIVAFPTLYIYILNM